MVVTILRDSITIGNFALFDFPAKIGYICIMKQLTIGILLFYTIKGTVVTFLGYKGYKWMKRK